MKKVIRLTESDLTKIVKFVTPDDDNLEGLLQAA